MASRKSKANTDGAGTGSLVIVESPAKARTIGKILGNKFTVKASMGHVRDLPEGKLGIEVEDGFRPHYEVMKDKANVVRELRNLGASASEIYLATDPDREGEAISWHLVHAAGWGKKPVRRVVFHEITGDAVSGAFRQPREIDMHLVDAQQARRILDRLVGYQLSPLLWKKVQRGLSAGRVQSVALRLVVEREKEILAFIPKEFWRMEAKLQKRQGSQAERAPFVALLQSVKGHRGRFEVPDKAHADAIASELQGAGYTVASVQSKEVHQTPPPPFTTSTLQQEAWRKLRMSAKRTMFLAQQLYEGVELGTEGSVGLITYMRTDSTHVAAQAIHEAREFIHGKYGDAYLPKQPRVFTRKQAGAQEAHEAIRPTSIHRTADSVKRHLTSEQLRLYDLIWSRMLASQMAGAVSDYTTADVEARGPKSAHTYLFRATGTVLRFPGFRALYMEGRDDDNEEDTRALPPLVQGEGLHCLGLEKEQRFTQPPPRYTEATLVKALEEKGIGRPSTYAPILSTIQDRGYVEREQGRLKPTTLGVTVSDLLVEHFPSVMDFDFTAHMEEDLDEIASGQRHLTPVLKEFYGPFEKALAVAADKMPRVKVEEALNESCPQCNKLLVIKTGRFGRFIACSGFPACRYTRRIVKSTGAKCPECGGDLLERKGKKRGRLFYGCANFPTCKFLVNRRPLAAPCPECSGLMVVSGRERAACTKCAWKGPVPKEEAAPVEA